MKLTGILLAWHRLDNLPPIVEGMLSQPFFGEVVVWSNLSARSTRLLEKSLKADFGDRVTVTGSTRRGYGNRNLGTYGRYLAARLAATDLVATCDDDVLVDNWSDLLELHRATNMLAFNVTPQHAGWGRTRWVHRYAGGAAWEAMVGWGAIFSRRATYVLDRYVERFGEDDLLFSKADRIFTLLLNRPHVPVVHGTLNHLPGHDGPEALYRQPGHRDLVRIAGRRAVRILEGAG